MPTDLDLLRVTDDPDEVVGLVKAYAAAGGLTRGRHRQPRGSATSIRPATIRSG